MRTDTMGRRRWLTEEKRTLIALNEKGLKGVEIAEILDREPHMIYAFMSRHKIKSGQILTEEHKAEILRFRRNWRSAKHE